MNEEERIRGMGQKGFRLQVTNRVSLSRRRHFYDPLRACYRSAPQSATRVSAFRPERQRIALSERFVLILRRVSTVLP